MKKSLILLVLCMIIFNLSNAQEQNKFRFDIRLGYATPPGGSGGILFHLEPKWTITDNMNVGLRVGAAAYFRSLELDNNNVNTNSEAEIGASGSYIGTYDYYFSKDGSSFAPFIGAGFGYYQVANVEIDDNTTESNTELETDGKLGGMIRGGFDWGKFRVAAEYNLIGKSSLRDVNNNVIGTAKNGYFGLSIGAYFGGGKWGK